MPREADQSDDHPKLGILVGVTLFGLCIAGALAGYLMQREMLNARIDQVRSIVEMARNMAAGLQKQVEAGELTEEEAAKSERRNIILQALGPDARVKVDLTHQEVRKGDILVLCSDGLSGQLKKEEIAAIATRERDLQAACDRLIALANERGGADNITVVVVRLESDSKGWFSWLRRGAPKEASGNGSAGGN